MNCLTFDAGALIAVERNDRRVMLMLSGFRKERPRVIVPAAALAQVLRNPATQVRLWRMLQEPTTLIVPLDGTSAQWVGKLLARTRTSDIADAHVAVCAQHYGCPVLTSDPFDIKRLAPELQILTV